MQWKGYPNSENSSSWEPVEGLDNAVDLVQAWWTDKMPGDKFPTIFSAYITVCLTRTGEGFEQHSEAPAVDRGSWEPHLDTDYNTEEIQFLLLYV